MEGRTQREDVSGSKSFDDPKYLCTHTYLGKEHLTSVKAMRKLLRYLDT